jgi:Chromate transporter
VGAAILELSIWPHLSRSLPGGEQDFETADSSAAGAKPQSQLKLRSVLDGDTAATSAKVSLATIAIQWLRLGCIGFGGPPTHIALLRRMCVEQRHWLDAKEFEDGISTTSLLPGPASTQLAIFCAWRLRGAEGAILGGVCFIAPGLVLILALSAAFLATHPPLWILGAAAGAGAARRCRRPCRGTFRGLRLIALRRRLSDRTPRVLRPSTVVTVRRVTWAANAQAAERLPSVIAVSMVPPA